MLLNSLEARIKALARLWWHALFDLFRLGRRNFQYWSLGWLVPRLALALSLRLARVARLLGGDPSLDRDEPQDICGRGSWRLRWGGA
jgi:hypothetical protein